jgi:hypothetical protein
VNESAALSTLRECLTKLLHAGVSAAHARALLSGACELVGTIDDAITLVNQLLAEAGE